MQNLERQVGADTLTQTLSINPNPEPEINRHNVVDYCVEFEVIGVRGCRFIVRFYRATLCVSAVFAVDRCLSLCLSVCPSVTFVHCRPIQISSNFFLRPVAPSFYFVYPSAGINSKGNLFSRGAKYRRREKFAIFD